jgi:hypothetical protein
VSVVLEPPEWPDTAASDEVADWVIRQIEDFDDEAERQFAELRWDTHPGIPLSEIFRGMEREAVEAAVERGDTRPLKELLHPDNPMNSGEPFGKRISRNLSPNTYDVIQEYSSGNRKRPTNRPRMSNEERRAKNPIYDAAKEVPRVAEILRESYPAKPESEIHDQAVHAVARHWLVPFRTIDPKINDEGVRERLINFLKRRPDDPRRLRHPGTKPKPKAKRRR